MLYTSSIAFLIVLAFFFFHDFSDKGLNFVYQLFDNNGNVKSGAVLKKNSALAIFRTLNGNN